MLCSQIINRTCVRPNNRIFMNLLCLNQSTKASDPIVKVVEGRLRGSIAETHTGKSYFSFQGIPYAEPPVGSLRFRDPRYLKPWSSVRDAIKPGNKCAQMNPMKPKKVEGSDDCLYLNVYTPSLPFCDSTRSEVEDGMCLNDTLENMNDENRNLEAKETANTSSSLLPVLVFVHGGRFLAGYGDYYRPDYFLDQDVIVVTVNYRFAALGLLCLDIPEVPGNAGHKDIVFALRWVRKNIRTFNGDPNNVTVMGESASACLVSGMLASPMTDGLFNKIIIESGSCNQAMHFWVEDELEKAREIVKLMGESYRNPYDILDYLQKAPLENIIKALYSIQSKKTYLKPHLAPVIEKTFDGVESFYNENPRTVFKNGNQRKLPMIVGYNNLEGAFFLWRDSKGNIKYDMDLNIVVPMFLGFGMYSHKAKMYVEDLKKFYFEGKPVNEQTLCNLVNLLSDQFFLRDIYIFVEQNTKYLKDVYLYQFSYQGTLNSSFLKGMPLKGAAHSDILGYQFLRPKKANTLNNIDHKVISLLAEGWCNFIKNGKPSWQHSAVEWLPVQKDKLYTLEVNTDLSLLEYPVRERMEFCKSLLDKYEQKKSKP